MQGIVCPSCGHTESSVEHTRRKDGCIVRERECEQCGLLLQTTEKITAISDANGTYAKPSDWTDSQSAEPC